MLGGEIQAREFAAPTEAKENGPVDNYGFSEQQLQQVPESENVREENSVESNGSIQNTVNTAQDQLSASVEEPIGEPQKHTYASILRVAKGQSSPSVAPQPSFNKNAQPTSDWNHAPQPISQQATVTSNSFEKPGAETDVGVCYAFVEFEDMTGVHNAVKEGSAHVAGWQVYIEERRPNSNIPSRAGRGRGRGRGNYPTDAPRGRFGGRSFDRGDRDYSRSRGNGYYRPNPRQDRGLTGYQLSRNGQNQSE
ncbi:hypothetical protein GH714_021818 [Hevea brasiliensis]|uniref:Uncharacterized protein n=1 Tax=Hevea brasiliensis TaxID=3981 RepID=A0A6A6MJX9_HEVBR|nr:hypothetical protein GH714_021818 [Hevea brasiliensis]